MLIILNNYYAVSLIFKQTPGHSFVLKPIIIHFTEAIKFTHPSGGKSINYK